MNTIIIYCGYGNHTRMIANKIRSKLDCDILEIKPKISYSNDYQSIVDATTNNLDRKEMVEQLLY